jgi:hypothetical protein
MTGWKTFPFYADAYRHDFHQVFLPLITCFILSVPTCIELPFHILVSDMKECCHALLVHTLSATRTFLFHTCIKVMPILFTHRDLFRYTTRKKHAHASYAPKNPFTPSKVVHR